METELNEDSQNLTEEVVDDSTNIDTVDDTDTEATAEEKLAKLEETNKKLFARAKKAETELKASKESSDAETVKPQPVDDILSTIDKKVEEKLGEMELDTIGVSPTAKKSIKAYAQAEGLTIKQALNSDYFTFLKEKEDAAKKVEEASIGKGGATPIKQNFDVNNPPQVDMSTEEGQKTWSAYKQWVRTQG